MSVDEYQEIYVFGGMKIMSISLNAISKEILYDTNIDYYIDLYKFNSELVFSFKLTEILYHLSDCYCVEVEAGFFDIDCLKDKRKVIVAGTRNWISHPDKDGKMNIKDNEIFTSLVCAIEIKKAEFDSVVSLFSRDIEELKSITRNLLQNVMEIALYRYNEKAGGRSFLTPSYKLCDRIEVALYKNYIEKRYRRCYFRVYDFELANESEYPIRLDAYNDEVENWRYFYNKSVNELWNKKYVDSIISAAIAIEAFSWELVRKTYVEDDKISDFTSEVVRGKSKPLSAIKLYKKLIKENMLQSSMSKSEIESNIQKILNPRNDIMHGKKSIVGSWKDKAEEANVHINQLFSSFGIDLSPERYLEKNNQNEDISRYRNYVLKTNNKDDISAEQLLELSEKAKNEFREMELPIINSLEALFRLGRIDEAMKKLNICFAESNNKSATAVAIWNCLPSWKPSLLDEIMEKVDDKDERVLAVLGIEYLRRYRDGGKSDQKLIIKALDYVKESNRRNSKYTLANVIAGEILEELGSDEQIEIFEFFCELLKDDFGYPLKCAEYYMNKDNITQVLKYTNVFLDRFVNIHLIGFKVDFYIEKYNLNEIVRRSTKIISYLKTKDTNKEYIESCIKKINDAQKISLKEAVVVIDDIAIWGRGVMPQGNIIPGNPINIAGGYYIFK